MERLLVVELIVAGLTFLSGDDVGLVFSHTLDWLELAYSAVEESRR